MLRSCVDTNNYSPLINTCRSDILCTEPCCFTSFICHEYQKYAIVKPATSFYCSSNALFKTSIFYDIIACPMSSIVMTFD